MHCIYIATPKWRYSVAVVSVQTTTSMLARPTVHVQQLLIKRGIHLFIISPSSRTAMVWNEMLPVEMYQKILAMWENRTKIFRRYHATYLIGTRGPPPHCDNFIETNLRPFLTFPYGERQLGVIEVAMSNEGLLMINCNISHSKVTKVMLSC